MYKLNNEYIVKNTYCRENDPVLLLFPEEEVIQVIKWLKKSINSLNYIIMGLP